MYLSKKLIIRLCGNKKLNKDFDFNKVSSILIRPVGDAVGDAIAHIGYVQQLKALYPSSRIGVLVTDRNRDVYAHCALIDNLIDEKLFDYWKNRKKWQILLDFHESFTSMHIIGCALLSPQINMIFSKREKKYYNLQTLNHYDFHCPPRPNTHMADHLLDSKFAEYFPLERAKFTLTASEAELKQAAAYWKPRHHKVRVLLAPQGSYWKRNIPPQELADLLNQCPPEALTNTQFLICNAKNSEEYFQQIKSRCNKNIDIALAPKTTLKQYISLVASSDITVCVDSGTVHLACALNRPLLSFYANCPENINLWHPLPNQDVPNLMVISASKEESRETHNFPLNQASPWLNKQIDKCCNENGIESTT